MKLKYKILPKLNNLTACEMDLLVWIVQHCDEQSAVMYGAYYRDFCQEYNRCKQSFYNALYGLLEKEVVLYKKKSPIDYDIYVIDNEYPYLGETIYQQEGYVDLANPVFRSEEFKKLKAKEKYLAFELRKRSFENGHSYKHGTEAFVDVWRAKDKLGVCHRVLRGYLHTLSKICGFFSVGIKDGFYYITSIASKFRKPKRGQAGHRYDADLFDTQQVRESLNRLNIKYTPDELCDTVALNYQYRNSLTSAGIKLNFGVFMDKALLNSIDGKKRTERTLSAKQVHYFLRYHIKTYIEKSFPLDAPERLKQIGFA